MNLHSSWATGEITIQGIWHIQGVQKVGTEGGIPQSIGDLFTSDSQIQTVAIIYEHEKRKNSVVYTRLSG